MKPHRVEISQLVGKTARTALAVACSREEHKELSLSHTTTCADVQPPPVFEVIDHKRGRMVRTYEFATAIAIYNGDRDWPTEVPLPPPPLAPASSGE